MSPHPTQIILDCDPGVDDALALMLAHGDPRIALAGVTTVAGNHTLDNVTRNAQALAEFIGLDVPIARGAARPLIAPPHHAGAIHGASGLGTTELPQPTGEVDERSAAQFIIDTVRAAPPQTITLVPTGALTNIALAIALAPEIVERVDKVVLMGGSATHGNITPYAEFNAYSDPEAAAMLFAADWEVTMIGLNLTHQALTTSEQLDRIRALDTATSALAVDLLTFYGDAYQTQHKLPGAPIHDACAVAAVIDPSLITTVQMPVEVSLAGPTRGATLVDQRAASAGQGHHVAMELDVTGFWTVLVDALAALP